MYLIWKKKKRPNKKGKFELGRMGEADVCKIRFFDRFVLPDSKLEQAQLLKA